MLYTLLNIFARTFGLRFRFCDEERKKTEERWVTYERGKIQSSGKGAGYLKNSQGERTSVKERREGGGLKVMRTQRKGE